jgi:phage terminase large subunit GpA-like protein
VTAFIDVHDKLLFWCVCGWEEGFTGYVLDYGTYPDQRRRYFTMRDTKRTLGRACPGAGREGAVQAGLEKLASGLLGRPWKRTDGAELRIERLLIDSGYLPGVCNNVCHKVGSAAMLSKGIGIRAGNKPMAAYQRRPGERHGHHWYVPNVSRSNEFRHVAIDTNYWKTFVHARLATAAGDKGCLTLFGSTGSPRGGRKPEGHRLFAEHVAGSETWTLTEGRGRVVHEWRLKPSKPDNHWLDCLVGCAAGASVCGVRMGTEAGAGDGRKRLRLSELQVQRRKRA